MQRFMQAALVAMLALTGCAEKSKLPAIEFLFDVVPQVAVRVKIGEAGALASRHCFQLVKVEGGAKRIQVYKRQADAECPARLANPSDVLFQIETSALPGDTTDREELKQSSTRVGYHRPIRSSTNQVTHHQLEALCSNLSGENLSENCFFTVDGELLTGITLF